MLKSFIERFGITADVPKLKQLGNAFFDVSDLKHVKPLFKFFPVYAGKKICARTHQILPSVDFLQWLASHSKKKINLSKQEEWLFICGRDLPLKQGSVQTGLVLAINQHNECLGYGEIHNNKLKNLFDIAHHMRKKK